MFAGTVGEPFKVNPSLFSYRIRRAASPGVRMEADKEIWTSD